MSVKKNFAYNLSYQILTMILPLITTPYIARVIGAEGVGIQSYTFSIVSYFVLLSMLGISNHGNRSIAMVRNDKKKLSKTFWSIYSIQLIMATLMIIIYILYIIFGVSSYKKVFFIQMIYIISALLDINWFFFGMEQFKLTVKRNIVVKIISVISIFLFIKSSNDIYIYSLILALSSLISNLILWKFLRGNIIFIKPSNKDICEHIKPILILFIPVIAVSIYKIMDKVMIGSISNVTQVGLFENSEKIISIPMGIITALATVMLPRMSNLYANGDEKTGEKYILLAMKFVMFISIGSMFGLMGVSRVLIPIFLGEEFIECGNIVSLLSISMIFVAWANIIRTQYLIPKKKDDIYIKSTILGAIVNLIINFILIGRYGSIGAAIGTIFAEASVAIYQTILIRKELDVKVYLKNTIFYIIPGMIMCVVLLYIGNVMPRILITGIIQIIVGVILFFGISLAYMFIIKDDLLINSIEKIKNTKSVKEYINDKI